MVSALDWSVTPASNTVIGGITAADDMETIKVDDLSRALAAGVKAMTLDLGGATASGGAANAYTFAANGHVTALVDGAELAFRANHASTGAATLAVDALGTRAIRKFTAAGEADIAAGDIVAGMHCRVQYNSAANAAAGAWILLDPAIPDFTPGANDARALGSATAAFADLFLASGGVVNWNAGNVTLTHAAGALALSGSATDVLLDLSAANAGQIKFPAAQNASTDANTLDDYEEGTWTPTYVATTIDFDSVTHSTQVGRYTKIGHRVIGSLRLRTNAAVIGSGSGNLAVAGLPFTPSTEEPIWVGYGGQFASNNPIMGRVFNTSTRLFPAYKSSIGASTAGMMASDLATGSDANTLVAGFSFTV
ncbi:MAG: hypothetical protein KIS96_11005 [Bauldia sp.]|nr:hypothetical protein [Bauldia sp.]